jgi:hypothetical protein
LCFPGDSGTAINEQVAITAQTIPHDDPASRNGIKKGVKKAAVKIVVPSIPNAVPARVAPAMVAISV